MASPRKPKPRRRAPPPTLAANGELAPWRPDERYIYAFFDGERHRRADPEELKKRLRDYAQANPAFDLRADTEILQTQAEAAGLNEARAAAYERLIAATRYVFEVQPFQDLGDGRMRGLTIAQCEDLFWHFALWVEAIKKKQRGSPTSAAATGPPPSGDRSATRNTVACSGTVATPIPPSPMPSPPPSAALSAPPPAE